jgi:DNA-directed RNA polymerase specialized sigma24 family protein
MLATVSQAQVIEKKELTLEGAKKVISAILRDIEDLDTAETATILEIIENAVKIRLHRARQALMTLIRHALHCR